MLVTTGVCLLCHALPDVAVKNRLDGERLKLFVQADDVNALEHHLKSINIPTVKDTVHEGGVTVTQVG